MSPNSRKLNGLQVAALPRHLNGTAEQHYQRRTAHLNPWRRENLAYTTERLVAQSLGLVRGVR
jgi:hypothetical protein